MAAVAVAVAAVTVTATAAEDWGVKHTTSAAALPCTPAPMVVRGMEWQQHPTLRLQHQLWC